MELVDLEGLIAEEAEPFASIAEADLDPLLERIGDAKVVLIGEASHGTSEFYRMRVRITKELIERRGFTIVAAEADWPDAERVDEYVRLREGKPERAWEAFARFPYWMWRNEETLEFIEWLRRRNESLAIVEERAGFYGLDLYSLHRSMQEVIAYLGERDVELTELAKLRYGGLLAYQDPVEYGRKALLTRYASSEDDVVRMLLELLERRLSLMGEQGDGESFFDAERNASVVEAAEKYYRLVFQGSYASWNHRDRHIFSTLEALLAKRGESAKAVVWAHNSHVGDAARTQMKEEGEINIGELARAAFGEASYLIGFGTHAGTVAAASDWGGSLEIKDVRPSHERSFERLFHDCGVERFFLPLRHGELRRRFDEARLQRAIGVIYRPQTELQSHYFQARLAQQFDEYIWFDQTRAVTPIEADERAPRFPERHPFLLVD